MVSSNQRSINEGIRKVIGSSNRGFATMDPERQPRIVTQAAKAVPASGKTDESSATQTRDSVRARQGNVAAKGDQG
jgi:hypothetical protein